MSLRYYFYLRKDLAKRFLYFIKVLFLVFISFINGFLKSKSGSNLKHLRVELDKWHEALRKSVISKPTEIKGDYRNLEEPNQSFKFLYPPVDSLDVNNLTYEIFIELINKTDWNIRKLIESLEKKMNQEQKAYQIEKTRVRNSLKLK